MIVIRNTFLAKPGQASKLAAQLKEAASIANMQGTRVMTDLVGNFNTVVLEHEGTDLMEFEARMKEYASNAEMREKMKGYTDLWSEGKREIFQVL